ncbi:MAG: Gfo/Idh/MocA family oxidoreductase [candidate division Zixibacteria bacterium]|nr:Gfo/Idh/MocA family oxidoreductase [candidate division Zixibacteria bacterium]
MRKLKTAVIGVGALGRHHLKWLSTLEQSQLVGLFDTDPQRAETYAAEYKVSAFKSLDDVANSVDAVSIVTPTTTHFEVASFFIERGIHCLIEKPITALLEEGLQLSHLAEKKKVTVTVGQIERFNPAVRALADYEMRPSFIEAHRLAAFDPRGTDVAVVLDLMIHDIDLALKLVGSQVSDIQAAAVSVISEQADIANARITFENGAVANLTASRISLQAMRKMRIFQQSGYFSLDLSSKQTDVYRLATHGGKEEGMRIPFGKSGRDIVYTKRTDTGEDMLGAELASFLNAVITGGLPEVSAADACEALRVALEVERIGTKAMASMITTGNLSGLHTGGR